MDDWEHWRLFKARAPSTSSESGDAGEADEKRHLAAFDVLGTHRQYRRQSEALVWNLLSFQAFQITWQLTESRYLPDAQLCASLDWEFVANRSAHENLIPRPGELRECRVV